MHAQGSNALVILGADQPRPPAPPAADDGVRLKIGDVARMTDRTVRALRLYEELGLLEPDARTEGGFRMYTRAAVDRVAWIDKMQALGFTLGAIAELAGAGQAGADGAKAMGDVKTLFHDKLHEVRSQIEKMRALEAELVRSLEYLEQCSCCHRGPVNEVCGTCAEPGHDAANTPSLVTGIRRREGRTP